MKYCCSMCNKQFNSPISLGGHKGSHSRKGIKIGKYIKNRIKTCEYCKKEYKSKNRTRFCSRECFGKSHSENWTKKRQNKFLYNVQIDVLQEYKKNHTFCEICGKEETAKGRTLAFDHDHMTGNFRGMLCFSCNVRLEWFIENSKGIETYIKNAPIV